MKRDYGRITRSHAKRIKTSTEVPALSTPPSRSPEAGPQDGLLRLPQDLRLRIVQYLDFRTDLSEYTCVSKQCREDRNHPSLKHIVRWAKVIIGPGTPVTRILASIEDANERGIFNVCNGLHIEYSHTERMEKATITQVKDYLNSLRLSVTHLRLTAPKVTGRGIFGWKYANVPNCIPSFLSKIMRNLQWVKLQINANVYTASNFASHSQNSLRTFHWDSSHIHIHLDGRQFKKCASNLKLLCLDYCVFEGLIEELRDPLNNPHFLYNIKDGIEMLSIVSACCWYWDSESNRPVLARIPQQSILQFLRSAPRLKWLRISHQVLSPENIAMMKVERPGIKFVVEDDAVTPLLDE